ncbi:hypothetical protein TNCV_3141761 [Trichonephila clavipes]|nr:hypothetical protein TNCV_3141761 [Trichonephila clavipes]
MANQRKSSCKVVSSVDIQNYPMAIVAYWSWTRERRYRVEDLSPDFSEDLLCTGFDKSLSWLSPHVGVV